MRRILLVFITVLFLTGTANAYTVTYGWEDGGTILGNYYPITATNVDTYAHGGTSSLELIDGGVSTPQAYVGWITGLTEGDVVTAGFWVYDTTAEADYPKGRIWGHYTSDASDIDSYAGSASGNETYSGLGWTYLEWTWAFDSQSGSRDGLVIEARTYTDLGDTIRVDDLTITAPDNATITTPATVPVPAAVWLLGSGLAGFFGLRRKRG